ncbi:MAG: glycosyltransferase family 2 protein [Desulfuromonadaceae bacterium]|nr:glycosyltransferase family 2 protein [Desulfuromonadaceae bacterium]
MPGYELNFKADKINGPSTISIIIPVRAGGYAAACEHIKRIIPGDSRYEVLLVEGSAPSQQRNLAAREARGEILYFLDDDSLITVENLDECFNCMADPAVAIVGGPSITPATDSWLQQVFGLALASPFGSGAVNNRYRRYGATRETTDKELILCNLAVRRSLFMAFNGFDERLYPNEENEFLDRVSSAGLKLIYTPSMYVFRSQRPTLNAFIRQMFNYGRGRAQQSLITGSYSVTSFIPLFFIVYLVLSCIFIKYVLLLAPLMLYVAAAFVSTLLIIGLTGRVSALLLLGIFPLMHCVNGAGLLFGILRGRPHPVYDDSVTVRRIKIFGQSFPE